MLQSRESNGAGGAPARQTAPDAAAGRAPSRVRRLLALDELGVLVALIALVLFIGAFHPNFLDGDVLLGTFRSAAFVAIIAYGLVFLLSMTEFDLSVGGTYAVSIVLSAKLMQGNGLDPWLAALVGVLAGVGLGMVNGLLANALSLPVIIITLGTLSMFRGLVTLISGGRPAEDLPLGDSFFTKLGGDFLGIPVAGWFALLLGAALTVVFTQTRYGAMTRAIGSNPRAAAFSGIPSTRIRLYALMLVGGLAGISGVLSLAYFQGADPTVGVGFELQVIAAAIIGGTAVSGGSGTVPGALIGALIVAVINSGLIFFDVGSNWSDFVTGAVIIVAVGSDALLRRRRIARALRFAES